MSTTIVLPVLAVTFCAWCVYLGGLASMQAICPQAPTDAGTADLGFGVGFPSAQSCSEVYSYWWFVMSFEFVAIAFGFVAAMSSSMLTSWRMSALGMFVIATILYIQASYAFYSLLISSTYYSGDTSAPQIHKVRTVVAGAIMTATLNGIAVIVLGMRDEDVYTHREATTTVDKGPVTTGVATAV